MEIFLERTKTIIGYFLDTYQEVSGMYWYQTPILFHFEVLGFHNFSINKAPIFQIKGTHKT
jgi:hypothetical protein